MNDQEVPTTAVMVFVFAPLWVPILMNLGYWAFNLN